MDDNIMKCTKSMNKVRGVSCNKSEPCTVNIGDVVNNEKLWRTMDAGFRTADSTDHANGQATYYAVRFDFVLLDISSLNRYDLMFRKHAYNTVVSLSRRSLF